MGSSRPTDVGKRELAGDCGRAVGASLPCYPARSEQDNQAEASGFECLGV